MTTITKERIELFIKNPLENGLTRGEQMELARIALASLGAEPVSQTYNLPELIEGMEVSIDVSTCDADLGNRYFGTVTEALELDTAKNGYILLVQDAEPNFDINGNSPVTPDGWVIVPKKLTAENGAKGVLSGEFSETTFISCRNALVMMIAKLVTAAEESKSRFQSVGQLSKLFGLKGVSTFQ